MIMLRKQTSLVGETAPKIGLSGVTIAESYA